MKNLHYECFSFKKSVVLFSILFAIFTLSGCASTEKAADSKKNSDKEVTYKAEFGLVENALYEDFIEKVSALGEDTTKKDLKDLRNNLYKNNDFTIYDNSLKGVTVYDFYDFLVEKGFSEEDAETEAAWLQYLGNDIVFFYYADSDDYKIWMYIEEE